jgi:iron complex transport system substrate-binding protein
MPHVLALTPHSLADVWDDIRRVGGATGQSAAAETLATALAQRVEEVASKAMQAKWRPRVLCFEWLEPYYVGGHWVPEMVAKAGGNDVLGRAGEPSFRVTRDEIADSRADIIVVMPCGYNAERAFAELSASQDDAWRELPAWREGRVFAVDANSYFSRPGPRLADGVAILAHLFHPDLFPAGGLTHAFRKL